MSQIAIPGSSATRIPPPTTPDTLPARFFEQARRRGAATALRRKRYGLWATISWTEYATAVRELAGALLSWGLGPGEAVALLGENRPEWVIADLAIQAAGGVTAAIYATQAPEGVGYVVEHAEARIVIVEDAEQLAKVLEVRPGLPRLERIVVMDTRGLRGLADPTVVFYDAALELGRAWLALHEAELEARLRGRGPDDPAMIIYTSGTTGRPKGALLSHRNLLFTAGALVASEPLTPQDEHLSFLPLSHIAERLLTVAVPIIYGCTVNFAESPETVLQDLREVRPTVLFAVPRVWEKLMAGVELHMGRADVLKRTAYRWAVGRGGPLAGAAVLRSLRQKLGLDRAHLVISGAAPISPTVLRFFRGIGVPIREGYGLTESSAGGTLHQRLPGELGTVGSALPGTEVGIAPDGEVLLRGPHVFLGYHKDPAATAEAIRDGWLHTGDVGELTPGGELRITGRKKDLFITAGGKNVAPAAIENKLKASSYVTDAVLVGDNRRYLTALVVIDEDTVAEWAQSRRIPFTTYADLAANPEVVKLISAEVEAVNKTLAQVETVKRFALLPKRLHQEDGEVTPTLKVKRQAVLAQYADLVESLYR